MIDPLHSFLAPSKGTFEALRIACFLALAGLLLAEAPVLPALRSAAWKMTAASLLGTITELSSDGYEGRLPGTIGEERSVAYLIAQCKALQLTPGAPDGGWTQTVPLWGTRSRGTMELVVAGKPIVLVSGSEYVAWSAQPEQAVDVSKSPLVFAGHGIVAPEYQWNDYAGIDVHGKTVLLLGGDPPVANDSKFQGKALSVYGRSGTKLQTAYKLGAAAVILMSASTQARAYQFASYQRENMVLRDAAARQRVRAQAVLSITKAAEMLQAAGENSAALHAAAAKPGFKAVGLNGTATVPIWNQVRSIDSANVIAKSPGVDAKLKSEYVVYSGHWDHHGKEGDQIFHGASDNAAGSAGVLELARAFKALNPSARRTMLFLWPTAEEKGLLGAKYYVEHPLYPLSQTVADINLDYFSNWGWGRTRDFSIVGLGNSTLDDLTAEAVKRQGRVLTGDTLPEQGFYFRSDHYEFARVGVPSRETSPGIEFVGRPANYGEQRRSHYIQEDYHQPSDLVKPDWDLSGALEDLDVLFEVGYRVAQQDSRPTWKPNAVWRPK